MVTRTHSNWHTWWLEHKATGTLSDRKAQRAQCTKNQWRLKSPRAPWSRFSWQFWAFWQTPNLASWHLLHMICHSQASSFVIFSFEHSAPFQANIIPTIGESAIHGTFSSTQPERHSPLFSRNESCKNCCSDQLHRLGGRKTPSLRTDCSWPASATDTSRKRIEEPSTHISASSVTLLHGITTSSHIINLLSGQYNSGHSWVKTQSVKRKNRASGSSFLKTLSLTHITFFAFHRVNVISPSNSVWTECENMCCLHYEYVTTRYVARCCYLFVWTSWKSSPTGGDRFMSSLKRSAHRLEEEIGLQIKAFLKRDALSPWSSSGTYVRFDRNSCFNSLAGLPTSGVYLSSNWRWVRNFCSFGFLWIIQVFKLSFLVLFPETPLHPNEARNTCILHLPWATNHIFQTPEGFWCRVDSWFWQAPAPTVPYQGLSLQKPKPESIGSPATQLSWERHTGTCSDTAINQFVIFMSELAPKGARRNPKRRTVTEMDLKFSISQRGRRQIPFLPDKTCLSVQFSWTFLSAQFKFDHTHCLGKEPRLRWKKSFLVLGGTTNKRVCHLLEMRVSLNILVSTSKSARILVLEAAVQLFGTPDNNPTKATLWHVCLFWCLQVTKRLVEVHLHANPLQQTLSSWKQRLCWRLCQQSDFELHEQSALSSHMKRSVRTFSTFTKLASSFDEQRSPVFWTWIAMCVFLCAQTAEDLWHFKFK